MTDDPYHDGGTRGSSGSATSHDAALADLTSGVTNATQKYVLIMAAQAGERGVTVAELREKTGGLHHGRISSAITKQHIAGRLVALTERRGHSGVYVTPEHVNGREARAYRPQNVKLQVEDVQEIIDRHQVTVTLRSGIWHCHECKRAFPEYGAARRHVSELIVALSKGEQ